MIVSPPPEKFPRIFWDLVWVFLQFGGIWSNQPSPRSWDHNPLEPNEDVVAARKDDLISKWLGTRRDQPLQEAQEAEPPKPEPRRFDSMGGISNQVCWGVMKLGPPHFFWGGGGKAKNTYMSNDRFFDGFSENDL